MFFRNILSQVMAGGGGENYESLPHSIYLHSHVGLVERVCDREKLLDRDRLEGNSLSLSAGLRAPMPPLDGTDR
jgi:hypothetical protein